MITLNRVGGVRLCFPLQVGQWAAQLCSFSHCLQHKTIYTHTSSAWVFCRYPNCHGWITLIRLSRWVNGRSWWFSHTLFTCISVYHLNCNLFFFSWDTTLVFRIRSGTENGQLKQYHTLQDFTIHMYSLSVHVPKCWGTKQVHCINKEKQIFKKRL